MLAETLFSGEKFITTGVKWVGHQNNTTSLKSSRRIRSCHSAYSVNRTERWFEWQQLQWWVRKPIEEHRVTERGSRSGGSASLDAAKLTNNSTFWTTCHLVSSLCSLSPWLSSCCAGLSWNNESGAQTPCIQTADSWWLQTQYRSIRVDVVWGHLKSFSFAEWREAVREGHRRG